MTSHSVSATLSDFATRALPYPHHRPIPSPEMQYMYFNNSGATFNRDLQDPHALSYTIRNLGIPVASASHLQRLISRLERGMLLYDTFGTIVLRSFAKARNLAPSEFASKAALVELLEEADSLFTRFKDLPAELRLRIHAFYFAGLKIKDVFAIAPPPLTLVSKAVRKESLPVFYADSQLKFQIFPDGSLNYATRCFLEQAPLEALQGVKKIWISAQYVVPGVEKVQMTSWGVEFAKGDWEWKFTGGAWSGLKGNRAKAHQELGKRLGEVMEGWAGREEGMKLRKGDEKILCAVFDRYRGEVSAGMHGS